MSAVIEAERTEVHLSEEERAEIIDHLREFGSQQEQSQRLADQGALDRAGELMRLYEDKQWVMELPAPGRRSKVPPDDFRRFTKWATENNRLGLKRNHVTYLQRSCEIHATLRAARANLHDASANSLRPLRWLVTNDYRDKIPEVWRDARQLADGDAPTEAQVKQALSAWKKRNELTGRTTEREKKGLRSKLQSLENQARSLMLEAPNLVEPILEKLLAEQEARRAATPPAEEW
jgi:hypothetical protein